jgi:hypothetical protein
MGEYPLKETRGKFDKEDDDGMADKLFERTCSCSKDFSRPDDSRGFLIGSTDGNTAIAVLGFRLVAAVCRVWGSLGRASCYRRRRLLRLLGLLVGLLLRLCLLLLRTLHIRARV